MKAVLYKLDFHLMIEIEGVNHFKLKPFDNNGSNIIKKHGEYFLVKCNHLHKDRHILTEIQTKLLDNININRKRNFLLVVIHIEESLM